MKARRCEVNDLQHGPGERAALDSFRATMVDGASGAGQPRSSAQHLDGGCLSQRNYTHSSGYIMKEKSRESHHLSLQITSNCVPFSPVAAFLKLFFLRAVGPAKLIPFILLDCLKFSLEVLFNEGFSRFSISYICKSNAGALNRASASSAAGCFFRVPKRRKAQSSSRS